MGLSIPEEIPAALQEVRNDSTSTDFAVVGFDSENDNKLVLLGTGENGVEGAKALLKEDDVCYALIRKAQDYEQAGRLKQVSTRFIFLYLRPESIPLKRKRVIGVAEGQVKKMFSPFAHSWEVATLDEVSDEKLTDIIDNIAMTKSHIVQKEASTFFIGGQPVKDVNYKKKSKTPAKVEQSRRLTVPDEIPEAIKAVRNESNSTNFVVVGFDAEDSKALALFGSGENGVEGIKTYIKEDDICYCLLKVDFNYETAGVVSSDGTRFIYVIYRPDSLSIRRKMAIGPLEGEINRVFAPYITNLEVDKLEDVTEQLISNEIDRITMKKNNVKESVGANGIASYKPSVRKMIGGVSKDVQKLNYVDQDAFDAALASVRKDSDETNWAIAFFTGDKKNLQIEIKATGTGGQEELAGSFDDDKVQYALLRTEKVVDGRSNTTRFTLIHFQPPKLPSISLQGAIGVLHGATVSAFGQHHSIVRCANSDDVLSVSP